jgi:GDPmannose 4,6-dehydratase
MRKALICGISGQDGSYLAQFLLTKGYEVYGSSRDAQAASFKNLVRLGIRDQVKVESVSLTDFRSVIQALAKIQPDEVYNLAGQSSVGLSFEQPVETLESMSFGILNLLEAIRFTGRPIRLYNSGSSECFGDTNGLAADENTPFRPRSPYAVAKATAFWEVANYREAYGLFACSGICSNHESPLRAERYVTRKIVAAACRIAAGSREKLRLGNIQISRDWGWAPEYVAVMWRMLQEEIPDDFVIATGETHTLEEFLGLVCSGVNLDWREHVVLDPALMRPSELLVSRSDPRKAQSLLGWKAKFVMKDVIRMMIESERPRVKASKAAPSISQMDVVQSVMQSGEPLIH